ncbi:DappuITG-like peptide [Daphnia pulex]|uniref:DappuITG-like peptide n=1 Tax=Daphnia pulex TaxID=6669 RepID=E9H740_DAPPU|nr:DappuITG-like peptide [Daphnia pulex]|eukprot:EFX72509.1 DappuITG-like peptide [Daphnia pulex]
MTIHIAITRFDDDLQTAHAESLQKSVHAPSAIREQGGTAEAEDFFWAVPAGTLIEVPSSPAHPQYTPKTRHRHYSMMLKLTLQFFAIIVLIERAYSWGGRFNRFSPEMLSNMGYGGYGNNRHSPQRFLPASSIDLLESMLQSEEDEEMTEASSNKAAASCSGRRCSANEHCCAGTVCVDLDGLGTCLPHHGRREGSACHRTSDCDFGLLCVISGGTGKICQQPSENVKQYNEDCAQSSECDVSKGLCCQLLRRHRQSPRKTCKREQRTIQDDSKSEAFAAGYLDPECID